MAKWEIIEDNKFKKGKGGKTTATRAVSAKRAAVKAAATPNNLTIITPEQKEKAQEDYDEAYKWTSDYMKSPMYKKMLTESSANTREFDNIDKTRWSNFKSIPPLQILPQPRNEPNTGGTSLGFNGQVQLFPYGFGAKAIYSHELSHSTDRPVEESDSRIIPQSDKNYISQHVPTTFEDSPMYATNKSFYDLFKKNKPKEYKKEAKDYKKFHINYVGQDTETRARLNAIRQGAQQNNLYDPFKEGVTPELYYDKLKNFKFEKEDKSGADPMYQLKNVYSDEEIIYMLNHISENKKENDGTELDNLPKAKNGLVIEDPRGQWAHPGSVTRIPSNQITMQGVNYPVLGVSDKGHTQMMYPGEDYSFRGKLVTEYPMMQGGGATYAELKNQILNTRLPATNRPTLNLNFNRSKSTTSPLSLQALGEQDYGVSLNKNGLNLSAGLNLGRFSGGLNYGYNQEGDKAHNFGANANLGLGKNLNLSADTNFDSNKNYQVNASLKYNFQDGGEVNFTYAGENHRVYKKESPTGNGKGIEGHIMVNHPTENKGKWDTIDLTKITNGKVKTVAQGVASTKKWHKENPEYADGGMIKRADGSYSKRGLWDNIRDNAGSGKKPTPEMLKQERKIKSQYANGGQVSSWEIIEDTPKFPNGGAAGKAARGITGRSKNNPITLPEVLFVEPKNVIQKPNITPYYIAEQDATYKNQPIIDKLKAQGVQVNINTLFSNLTPTQTVEEKRKILNTKGILPEQEFKRNKYQESLSNNLRPIGYDYNNFIKALYKKTKGREILENKAKDTDPYASNLIPKSRLDAFNFYMGKPQKYNTFDVSDYRPSKETDSKTNYYKLNYFQDYYAPDSSVTDLEDLFKIKSLVERDFPFLFSKKEKQKVNAADAPVMANYTLSKGEDEKGKYYSYYDKWDIAPMDFGKPFEIYDRIYYDPKTKKIVPPKQSFIQQPFIQKASLPGQSVALPPLFKTGGQTKSNWQIIEY